MQIDFSPVTNNEIKLSDFCQSFTQNDLFIATNKSINAMLDLIECADDRHITFIPTDPYADDPHAPPEERHAGWNLAHLVLHTTASSEEWAAISSILARGIPYGKEPRLRYEPDWRTFTTRWQVAERLEESRQIRLGYLNAWPDVPHLDNFRDMSPRFIEKTGPVNATVAFLFGLKHEIEHLPQIREAARQAMAAFAPVAV